MSEQVQIAGSVERITYYNAENGYTVLRLKPDSRGMLPFRYASGREALITVVGNLPEVQPGEWLKLTGKWGNHAKHGRQFLAEFCEQSLPATTEGIKRYLGSGLIRGVGKVMAERIVERFGEETLDVIEYEPERLQTVLGIGRKRVGQIIKAWDEQRAIKDVMIFLQSHGVSTNLATKIYKKYGDTSLAVVQNTPYKLVQDVYGIGFKTADKIAQALGLAADDPGRIEAGIAYTLNRMAEDGHVYMPQEALEPEAAEILGLATEKITAVIDQLETSDFIKRETLRYPVISEKSSVKSEKLSVIGEEKAVYETETPAVREERAVYLTPFYFSEIGVTKRIQQLIEHPTSRLSVIRNQSPISNLQSPNSGVKLAPQQLHAIQTAVTHKVTILTGGPGTGKTTTMRALLDLLDRHRLTYALASPTGRAAKRLAEATGREAKTVHRLLEFKPGEGFGRSESNSLDADMIVIDEASMLDLMLTYNLLKAVSPDSHLLLVGDVDQLPSVGAGDVLADLIDSGKTAVVRLQTIFRQAADSLIISNAHLINEGKMPQTTPEAQDFFLFVKEAPDEAAELLVDVVKNRVPLKFKLDPLDDIQVLAPMYNGAVGVNNLNLLLQEALNPGAKRKAERKLGGRLFRVGDKVMQTVNNYDKNVYNGDIGRVTDMDILQQNLTVSIDGAPVVYDFLEVDELVHAYAISVHKCVAADTYIFTANGIQQIKDLWPDANGVRVRPLKTHVITHEGWAETNQIFKGTVEPTITIKTRFGYSLTGSMRHPVLVYDATTSDFVWKKMPDLKLDDWLPIQRNINAFPNEAFGTAAFQINNPNNQRKHCAIPETVNEALGTLLGYLVGDGSYNDQKDGDIRFTNSDLHMHTHFQQLLAELFGLEMTLNRSTAKRKALTYYVIRRTLRDFLLYLGLDFHPANRKEVPYTILHSPKNVQAAFLKALYDCDGSASGNSTRVVLVTASAKLAEQVQMMLLNFGIVSRLSEQIIHTKKYGNQSYYRLATFGLNTVLFAQEIGFSQDHKVAQLAQLVARSKQGQGKTNVDFIPNGRSLMAELKIAFLTYLPQQTRGKKGEGFWGQLPFSTARLWHDLAQGKYQLNYTHLQKILPVAAEACSQITTTAAYQKLQTLLNKNFFFEPIVQISEGAVQVYDISVPADKSFISNGFISHNSQGAEYPCVVMPVATQHYLMLQRNLLYTAVTRAKKLVILVGTRKAIRIAVKNDKTTQRHTALDWRLQK